MTKKSSKSLHWKTWNRRIFDISAWKKDWNLLCAVVCGEGVTMDSAIKLNKLVGKTEWLWRVECWPSWSGREDRLSPLRCSAESRRRSCLPAAIMWWGVYLSVGWCHCCSPYSHTAITALHPPVTSASLWWIQALLRTCFLAALH